MRRGNTGLALLACFWALGFIFLMARTARCEIRGLWVDGFNEGYKTPGQCDTLVAEARLLHYNALFVQMRRRGDAYYSSHYEPWASDDPQHFDALAYLCRVCHAPGSPRIAVHAWLNACAVGGNTSPRSVIKSHPEWTALSDTGKDFDGESTKIDPGNTRAAEWTYRVMMDVVRHYDIDGIQLDSIRYGGDQTTEGHWGYNLDSIRRFQRQHNTTGTPAWNDPQWQSWRRAQVTGLVKRVYIGAHKLQPGIVVSADTICWGKPPADERDYERSSASYVLVYAPWRNWMRDGIIDLNCPMTYFNQSTRPDYFRGWSEFVKANRFGRLATMGLGQWLNTPEGTLAQLSEAMAESSRGGAADGTVCFSYAHPEKGADPDRHPDTGWYETLLASGAFSAVASQPKTPWLSDTASGKVSGTVLVGSDLRPMDGALVALTDSRTGKVRTSATDGNGWFGYVDVPAGRYNIQMTTGRKYASDAVIVTGGAIVSADLTPGVRVRNRVSGIGDLKDGERVTLSRRLISNVGPDPCTSAFVSDGFGNSAVSVTFPKRDMPLEMGDVVTLTGLIEHVQGETQLHASVIRVVDAIIVQYNSSVRQKLH